MQHSTRFDLLSLVVAFAFVVTSAPGQSTGGNVRGLAYSSYLGGYEDETITGVAVDAAGSMYVAGSTMSTNFPITRGVLQVSYSAGEVGFVAKFDRTGKIVYSTFFPAVPNGIAVDDSGNVYVTGDVRVGVTTQFPTTPGAFQTACKATQNLYCSTAFVSKLNPTGSALVYSTLLGVNVPQEGAGVRAAAIAVDSAGSAYVTGDTDSSDFPTTGGVLQPVRTCATGSACTNAFLTKLNSSGSGLVYSTFLREVSPTAIAVDASGNAFLSGGAGSRLPATPGSSTFAPSCGQTGSNGSFVTKVNPTATAVVYSFGLYCSGGNTFVKAVALDKSQNLYLTGGTDSREFPITPGAFQTDNPRGTPKDFIVKLNATGTALAYSTYLGGSSGSGDAPNAIAVDSAGRAYVAGQTYSADFPVSPNAAQTRLGGTRSAFVTVMNATGTDIVYSTFLGGSLGSILPSWQVLVVISEANGICVDAAGNAYVAGRTTTLDFPTKNAFQAALSGLWDAFFAKLALKRPTVNAGGTVNGASFTNQPLAGAAIGSLFGADLALATGVADATPLPTSLAGVTVQMNDTKAPLFFVSPTQINFQVPWELMGLPQASLTVTTDGVTSDPQTVAMALYAPGLFATNSAGSGQGAVLVSATGEVAAPTGSIPGRAARAVKRGEFLSIYCTGLGPVSNRPATGARSPSSPLSESLAPTVTIGGVPANVSFSGLAPGFVGLYQVDVQVPDNAPTGSAVPVALTIGGVTSNTVTIAVQ